ncbi:MAG: Ig-like domain-containing protein [Prevotella sp.]|nr:Ig-like domain-containing protein [Prevotella sp.]
MGSPDGGWYDEDPPRIVSASPADRSIGATTGKVRIVFNEFIKIDNPSEKVIVSPPQIQPPEIKAAGKSIVVELKDSLKPNTTYTIDFSDAITDNNEGNPLGSFTYSFSTGTEIDTMEVSGYVLEAENLEPVKGIAVGIYPADAPDSVFQTEPLLRITRTDSRGHFVIKGIAPGSYRAFALQDMDGDYAFSQKNEKIAFNHDIFVPSSKPDTRHDTIWRDTLHIDRILAIPYTHFLPDDIVLRAFTETQTDRFLLKNERKEANRLDFYFTYGDSLLPEIKGLNFNADKAFVVEANEQRDTLFYWLRDTTLVNQDTLQMVVRFQATDTLGNLTLTTDTLEMLSKQPYAKRMKQKQKEYDEWLKTQEKRKKKGQPYDSIMPVKNLNLKIQAPPQLDPDKNIFIDSPTPIETADTSKIHLYVKIDTLWYQARYEMEEISVRQLKILGEWRPEQEYSLEIDSAAITDIYGNVSKPFKQGLKVKGYDAYGTILLTIPDMNGKNLVVQLLNTSDAVVKQVVTNKQQAQFSFVDPGTYYLRLFVDENGNGKWDTGLYEADLQPEPMYYYHEAIECKAKWDITQTWNPKSKPIFLQKPEKITKQKAEKQKTIRNKNAERAKQLGIEYINMKK